MRQSVTRHEEIPLHVTNLGEIQPVYQQFIKSYEYLQYFTTTDYHHKKIAVIKKQIHIQNLF